MKSNYSLHNLEVENNFIMTLAALTWGHILSKVISVLFSKVPQKCKPFVCIFFFFFESFGKMATFGNMYILYNKTKAWIFIQILSINVYQFSFICSGYLSFSISSQCLRKKLQSLPVLYPLLEEICFYPFPCFPTKNEWKHFHGSLSTKTIWLKK